MPTEGRLTNGAGVEISGEHRVTHDASRAIAPTRIVGMKALSKADTRKTRHCHRHRLLYNRWMKAAPFLLVRSWEVARYSDHQSPIHALELSLAQGNHMISRVFHLRLMVIHHVQASHGNPARTGLGTSDLNRQRSSLETIPTTNSPTLP